MSKNDYESALAYARRHIENACYGRPCLDDCLRRLGGALPPCACAGGWRAPRFAKWLVLLAALAVVLFASFHAIADVQCIWDGQTYQCSGAGSRVEVIGGGSSGPVVVTNFWGVCTNCVNMSPSQCNVFKSDLETLVSDAQIDISHALDSIENVDDVLSAHIDDISTFQKFGKWPKSTVAMDWPSFTNYIKTVDNTQTEIVRGVLPQSTSVELQRRYVSYSNGIYDYSQYLLSDFQDQKVFVESSLQNLSWADSRLSQLGAMSSDLDCSQCQPEYEPGGSPGGGGGGAGVVTNVVANGNWCTYDQGEALKSLLGDLKTWAQRQHAQLVSISNYVQQTWQTLRSGLYSDYTAVPRGEDWQTLYLQGQPTGWGYDPTNILQRIEVLLYGISGISTNVSERLEDTTPDAESSISDINDAVATIATDASDVDARSLGDAIVKFFRAFTPQTKDYSGGEEILAEVQYSVGNESFYVPSVRLGSSGFLVDTMATVKSFVSGFCSVLFWVGGAFAIFRFWVFFAGWCVKLSKWAVELTTSLFAS